jgi:hypothetical protein
MLAELAVRAGYPVLALDYFGDADLQTLCPSRSLLRNYHQDYSPTGLVNAAAGLEAGAVVYSASLENHPAEVARLSQGRRLLGNSPAALEKIRNPARLAAALRAGGFLYPETVVAKPGLTVDPYRRWLWKPLRSGGGHGIRRWQGGPIPPEGVLQEQLLGLVGSMAFVANGQQAILLGLTEQLVGRRVFGASGFRYCGNLLPPRLPPDQLMVLAQEAQALATYLTEAFGLQGLNGLDFIWSAGRLWTIEVNPRPSASLELIDLAYGVRVFEAHVRAFTGQLPNFNLSSILFNSTAAGKTILYASDNVVVGDTRTWVAQGIRDVPHPGEHIRKRYPICTILTTGATPTACLRQLKAQAAKLKNWLKPEPVPI